MNSQKIPIPDVYRPAIRLFLKFFWERVSWSLHLIQNNLWTHVATETFDSSPPEQNGRHLACDIPGAIPMVFWIFYREHFMNASSQWEITLHCYVVSHWLGAYTNWSLIMGTCLFIHPHGAGPVHTRLNSALLHMPGICWCLLVIWLLKPCLFFFFNGLITYIRPLTYIIIWRPHYHFNIRHGYVSNPGICAPQCDLR